MLGVFKAVIASRSSHKVVVKGETASTLYAIRCFPKCVYIVLCVMLQEVPKMTVKMDHT